MRKSFWLAFVGLIGALAVLSISHADPPEGYPFLRFDEALKAAKQQNKKIFLYYGRYGCGYCDKTNKEAFSDPSLRKLYIDHYILTYVDAESGRRLTLPNGERLSEMELGARLKALVTPVFIYMEVDAQPIVKIPGVQTVQDFRKYDQYIYGGHYKYQTLAQFSALNP